jgi:hypothetical protein
MNQFEVRKDDYGYPAAIAADGIDWVHLTPSQRTMERIDDLLYILNLGLDVKSKKLDARDQALLSG